MNDLDKRADAVATGIVARHPNADGIDVAGSDLPPRRPRCPDGKHAGPAADIENAAWTPPVKNAVERCQAALRRAVMPGAEGEPRLDLDADPIWRDPMAVMRAVDHKPAGCDGHEPCEALRHPIAGGDSGERQAFARRIAGNGAEESPHGDLVRRLLEVDLHGPPARLLKGCNRSLSRPEGLAQVIEKPSRRVGVRGKPGERRSLSGRNAHHLASQMVRMSAAQSGAALSTPRGRRKFRGVCHRARRRPDPWLNQAASTARIRHSGAASRRCRPDIRCAIQEITISARPVRAGNLPREAV
jgi:hypothetical protein